MLKNSSVSDLTNDIRLGSSRGVTGDGVSTRTTTSKHKNGFWTGKKYRLRAMVQSTAFLLLIAAYLLFGPDEEERQHRHHVRSLRQGLHQHHHPDDYLFRDLQDQAPLCSELKVADPAWMCVFYVLGILYLFLALAIICDEFFVPALEEMASSRRLNLSMDVAGATLMAAGGSAPELFSNLFGTFQNSSIGIGTIIGSAVFNVLFVIAMCSVFAKEVLNLSWWPLFRDAFCYAIGLVVLIIFVGVTSPTEIELWEAIVLFVLYLCYIAIMWKNRQLYKLFTGKELPSDEEEEARPPLERDDTDAAGEASVSDGVEKPTQEAFSEEGGSISNSPDDHPDRTPAGDGSKRATMTKTNSNSSISSVAPLSHLQRSVSASLPHYGFRWQGTFRAGILKLLRHPNTWVTTGGVGIVAKIAGNADQVFSEIDANGDGHIDKDELRALFERLGCHVSDHELEEAYKELAVHGDGVITREDFNKWYTQSAELIRSQTRHIFDELDADKSGTLDRQELKTLLVELDPTITDHDVQEALDAMNKEGSKEEVSFEEFEAWYETSMIYERQKQAVEEDMQGIWDSLKPPCGEGLGSWIQYIIVFPLVLVMAFTIPDVRIPGWSGFCYLSFIISICWLGGFSYLMVQGAEIIGNTIGIPDIIMGLTVLAAGTSVPDLLSSVIVARRGEGDMAVSGSIGSNIFDILVGLPIPWILYTAWPTLPSTVAIDAKNIWIDISVLLGMLVFVIAAVHCQGWKLTKTLGLMMIIFYVGFLVMSVVIELPFQICRQQ